MVDLPVDRGCPILPWPQGPDADAMDADQLIVAVVRECLFVVSSSGRCGWLLSEGIRHLAAPPGDANDASIYLFPLLALPRGTD